MKLEVLGEEELYEAQIKQKLQELGEKEDSKTNRIKLFFIKMLFKEKYEPLKECFMRLSKNARTQNDIH